MKLLVLVLALGFICTLSGCANQQTDKDRVHGSAGMQMFSNNLAAGAHVGVPF